MTLTIAQSIASGVVPAPTEKMSQDVFYRSVKRFGSNTCSHAFDGDCDDGGEGSLYSFCRAGTDVHDCGDDSCAHFSRDGDCDDGGVGSLYSLCSSFTDTTDCHGRNPALQSSPQGSLGLCTDTCSSARDGNCDDGGAGAEYNLCSVGSDCLDCGTRHTSYLRAEASAIEQAQFPALREQKAAKSLGRQRDLYTVLKGMGGIAAVGVLLAVGILTHGRRAVSANAEVVPLPGHHAMM